MSEFSLYYNYLLYKHFSISTLSVNNKYKNVYNYYEYMFVRQKHLCVIMGWRK